MVLLCLQTIFYLHQVLSCISFVLGEQLCSFLVICCVIMRWQDFILSGLFPHPFWQLILDHLFQAQRRDVFIEERYGKYNISDPLMALQRDFEALKEENYGDSQPVCANPLSILKVVMKHCKSMQEKMLSQLAAAESRHRKVGCKSFKPYSR